MIRVRLKWTRLLFLSILITSVASFCGCSVGLRMYDSGTAAATLVIETTCGSKNNESLGAEIPSTPDLNGYVWKIGMPWASKYLPGNDDTEEDNRLKQIYNDIETLYNVEIEIKPSTGLADYLAAGASKISYSDVIGVSAGEIIPLAVNGYIYSVEDPMLLALGLDCEDKTKWACDLSRLVKWNGKQWTVQMNSAYDIPEFGSFILFNKPIVSRIVPEGIADIVRSGGWTNEKYLEIALSAAKDTDYDGKADVFGTLLSENIAPVLANGGQILAELDGVWYNSLRNPATSGAIGTLAELVKSQNGAAASKAEAVDLFCQGKAAFLWAASPVFYDYPQLVGQKDLYGLLPMPNDSGRDFLSPITSYTGYAFMTTNKQLDKSVIVFNILAQKLSSDWFGVYKKASGLDQDSLEMLDLIYPNAVFNCAAFDASVMNAFNEYVSAPLASGENVETVVKNAASAVDTLLTQKNSDNLVRK